MKNAIIVSLTLILMSMSSITQVVNASSAKPLPAAKNDPQAATIAKRAIAQLKKSAYKANFAFVYYNASNETTDVNRGEITIDKLLFRVMLNGIETKFDGLTQWVYMSENNEVTISEPTRDELVESNPMMMIEHYYELHRVNMDNEQPDGAFAINFFPKNPKTCDFFKIHFIIDEETYMPREMVMSQRNGDKVTLKWEAFAPIDDCPKSTFTFNVAEYPNVVVNDMR